MGENPKTHECNMFRYTGFTESYESLENKDREIQILINPICLVAPDLHNHMNLLGFRTKYPKDP